ncbi:hypothetical protein ES703_19384 [subsurface metagenome]
MTNKRSKKIGLLLMGILCFMILGSSALKSLHPSSETLEKAMDVRIAGIDNYKLDLTITWGSYSFDKGYDISLDNSGNIYITGETSSFGEGDEDAFIVKYDSSGAQQWNTTWGGTSLDIGKGIAVDTSGNVYITGETSSFDVGSGDVFIAKYNSSGGQQWNTTWGGVSADQGFGIALDSSGNICITGRSNNDAFIAKFDNSGAQQWNSTWGGNVGSDIVVDTSGNIYITGSFGGYGGDAFITKYNSSGAQQWNTTWGDENEYYGNGITLDSSGNIYISGYIYNTSSVITDTFIAKFNSSGTQQWNTTWGGDDDDYGNDIALDNSGNIYITGSTYSFGVGYGDVFIAKYNNSGTLLWDTTWGAGSVDQGHGIALDSSSNIYITGSYGISAYEAFILRYLPSPPSDKETISFDIFFLIPLGMAIVVITIYVRKSKKTN